METNNEKRWEENLMSKIDEKLTNFQQTVEKKLSDQTKTTTNTLESVEKKINDQSQIVTKSWAEQAKNNTKPESFKSIIQDALDKKEKTTN